MYKKGFTLIELLVVISIITLLSSVVMSSLNSSRLKSRDAVRKSDFRQMRNALEMYYDQYGNYPMVTKWACKPGVPSFQTAAQSEALWTNLETLLNPFIKKLSGDPLNIANQVSGPWADNHYSYCYSSIDGRTYDLFTQLENKNDSNRCANVCWKFHQGELPGTQPEGNWCTSCTTPTAGSFSNYIYADH